MPKDRGSYVSVYTVLLDSPEYDALSPNAAAVWWALKLCPEANQCGVFRVFDDQLSHRSKVPLEWVPGALQELQATDWIRLAGRWVWIRNHLRWNPSFNPNNPNHVAGLITKISGLPKIPLVREFVSYYQALNYLPADLESEALNSDTSPPIAIANAVAETKTNTEAGAPSGRKSKEAANSVPNSRETRALVEAYNVTFNAKITYSPGNLRAAARYYAEGYSLEDALALFEAVVQCKGPTAAWAYKNNHEFEYLVRPTYFKGGQTVHAMVDRVLNELATGRTLDKVQ